jgi:acyl-CoA synthetase (AMP-forming)/AMP-acid ligase II
MDSAEGSRLTTPGWERLHPGQKVRLTGKAGEQHTGIIEEQTPDGSIVWLFAALNGRKLFHRDEGFQVSIEFSEGSRKNESGGLVFHGRLKDMLKVGGENVAAIAIEAFLAAHPAVRTVEVVGAPDDRLDEVPVAFVDLEEGVCLEAEELIEYCRGRIARYKVPRAVYFMKADDWPMSATKISKKSLWQRLRPQPNRA